MDPSAVSPVGAEGLLQVMPATYAEVVRTLHWDGAVSAFDPARAVDAGAYYQRRSRLAWRSDGRTPEERNRWGLCAYNAGLGSCLKAQAKCGAPVLWANAAPCLADITGAAFSQQTVGYVINITQFAAEIRFP